MWFWRCVDFLEKRGETFTFTPKSARPAELSIEPPDIFAGLKKDNDLRNLYNELLLHNVNANATRITTRKYSC